MSFNSSLACVSKVFDQIKCLSLKDKRYMVAPTFNNLNPAELKYYSFMISSNECNGSCNVLSSKICVPKKAKDINIEAFNVIMIKTYEAKTLANHISCDCK